MFMNACDKVQAQMLDFLYGLLEEDEQKEVLAHIVECPNCRSALARAEEQQRLLAEAAKDAFPEVQFLAPTNETTERSSMRVGVRAPRPWGRLALAASVLLALISGGFFALRGWQERHATVVAAREKQAAAQTELAQFHARSQSELDRLNREIRAAGEEIQRLKTDWDKAAQDTERSLQSKKVQVVIRGPRNLQAGARNKYEISMRPRGQDALPKGPMFVRVVNPQTEKVLFERQLTNPAMAVIDLPADLPLKPGINLALEIEAKLAGGEPVQVREKVPLVPSLYMTHLTTDRPMYRPGETVRFRSLTLERFSLKPADEDLQIRFRITRPGDSEVFNASGMTELVKPGSSERIKGPDGKPIRGLGTGEFKLPDDAPGGEYTLHVSDDANRFPAEKRKFIVNVYQVPRLNTELVFTRKSYGPGDEIETHGKVSRVEGGAPVANQPVDATLQVDGHSFAKPVRTDGTGQVTVKFKLPERLDRGEGSLTLVFTDRGIPEQIVRPVPIVVKKLLVDFYPEGGDLIAGVPNRVYFQVHSPLGKPAELRGRIVDQNGNLILPVQTLNDDLEPGVNQGMGAFTFAPETGKKYELKIDAPIGIEGRHLLPGAKQDGVVLNVPKGVVEDRIDVVLFNTGKERKVFVGAYCRGRLIDNSEPVDMKPGASRKLTLHTAPGVSGVYRVTVFEAPSGAVENGLVPVAERLIYRRPVESLKIGITADKPAYHPGDKARLLLKSTTENKQPMPAIVMVSVVDLRVLKLADEKTARSMPSQFYLASEIEKAEDLEYADFLVSDHPKAAAALDLLLGTQGWRRFAEQNPQELLQKHPQAGQRLLALSGQADNLTLNTDARPVLHDLDQKFARKVLDAQATLATKNGEQTRWLARKQQEEPVLQTRASDIAPQQFRNAQFVLAEYERFVVRISSAVLVGLMLSMGVVCLVVGLMRLAGSGRHAVPYLATGASLLVLLFMISLIGTFYLMGNPVREDPRQLDAMAGNFAKKPTMPAPGAAEVAAPMAAKMAEKAEARPELERGAAMPPPVPAPPGGLGGKPADEARPPMQFRPRAMAAPNAAAPMKMPRMKNAAKRELPRAVLAEQPAARNGAVADRKFRAQEQLRQQLAKDALAPPGGMPPGMMPPGAAGGAAGPMANGLRLADGRGMADMNMRRPRQLEQMRDRQAVLKAMSEPFAAREYAHVHQTAADKTRRDFTETLFWHPVLVLPDGSAEVAFDLSDSTTQFQVLCQGHTLDGRLGSSTLLFASRLPYGVEPKVPGEISSTDKIAIPVAIANDTAASRTVGIEVMARGLKSLEQAGSARIKRQITVAGGDRKRELFRFEPSIVEGEAMLNLTGQFDPATSDSVERTFKIVPDGFPVVGSHSDMLEGVGRHEIVLPESWVPGTLKCQVQVYPSTLADLQKGLEAMLREPCGCFEQSSSSNYPNVLILNYLKETRQNQPTVEARARHLLQDGYQRLTSFECIDPRESAKRQGYEWFGQMAPPHEALTAYGLLQFRDMARVHPVDEAMMERTRSYLLGQRDGNGGFKRNTRAIDTFGRAPDDITNAYIVWALTESGQDDVEKEWSALLSQAKDSKDAYFLALVGNGLVNRAKTTESADILRKLAGLQQADGHLQGTRTSITGSTGRDLQIETTALAMLAWLKANRPEFNDSVNKAVKWIGSQRGGYGAFGATQSTILALKALIAHTRANRKTAHAGELRLFVHDQTEPVATKAFPAGCQEAIAVGIPGDATLKPGKNKIRVEITGNNAFPYTLSWSYRTLKPANAADCPVHLTAALDRAKAQEGDTVRLKVVVENKSGKGQGMAVAILGLPAGLSLPTNFAQLKDMARLRDNGTKAGDISFWEIRGRELVLYWRQLAPDQRISLNIDLVCQMPGEYRGPASRAYLYYNADRKFWIDPVPANIQPKGN
jgi:hypothetical protein